MRFWPKIQQIAIVPSVPADNPKPWAHKHRPQLPWGCWYLYGCFCLWQKGKQIIYLDLEVTCGTQFPSAGVDQCTNQKNVNRVRKRCSAVSALGRVSAALLNLRKLCWVRRRRGGSKSGFICFSGINCRYAFQRSGTKKQQLLLTYLFLKPVKRIF